MNLEAWNSIPLRFNIEPDQDEMQTSEGSGLNLQSYKVEPHRDQP